MCASRIEKRGHGVLVAGKAKAVDIARSKDQPVAVPRQTVANRQRLALEDAVPESGSIGREGLAADIGAIDDDIAAMHPPAVANELADFRPEACDRLVIRQA